MEKVTNGVTKLRMHTIDIIHKSQNATVPYPTMHHWKQKCAHFCSEWCIVGSGADALWDMWIWSISTYSHSFSELAWLRHFERSSRLQEDRLALLWTWRSKRYMFYTENSNGLLVIYYATYAQKTTQSQLPSKLIQHVPHKYAKIHTVLLYFLLMWLYMYKEFLRIHIMYSLIQWNLFVTTTSIIKLITCEFQCYPIRRTHWPICTALQVSTT